MLLQQGRIEEAVAHDRTALKLQPNLVDAHYRLAIGLFRLGQIDEAIVHFEKVIEFQPDNAEVHNNLGWALLQSGHVDAAIAHFQTVLKLQPNFAPAHANLALASLRNGKPRDAVVHYQSFLKLQPDAVPVLSGLAWLLATSSDASLRDGGRAITLAQRANELSGGRDPKILQSLAAAYAESGRFSEATAAAQRGLALVDGSANAALNDALRLQLKSYEAGAPFHELESPNPTTAAANPTL